MVIIESIQYLQYISRQNHNLIVSLAVYGIHIWQGAAIQSNNLN